MKLARIFLLASLVGLLAVLGIQGSGRSRNATAMDQKMRVEPIPPEGERVRVTVELFTSEGCSSCPPADALLARLVKEQPVPGAEIIALGEHVDYWNRLGWKDIYSSAAFSARQSDYARSLANASVYTPQMVVDGQVEFVGSDERRAREAIAAAARSPKLGVQLIRRESKTDEGMDKIPLGIRIETMPAIGAEKDAEVFLAVTEDELKSNVTRGENAGRHLRHAAVVRSLQSIGKLARHSDGDFVAEAILPVQSEWRRQNLHAVVLVQENQTGRVLGAATIALSSP